jgi:hypothetical protein
VVKRKDRLMRAKQEAKDAAASERNITNRGYRALFDSGFDAGYEARGADDRAAVEASHSDIENALAKIAALDEEP